MIIFIILIVLFTVSYSSADILTVDDDGPADYTTIQYAINDAVDGDIVQVFQGHYFENIDFRGKAITVTSADPNDPSVVENTIIDANGDGIVVSFHMGEDPNSVLTGFTITGGHAKYGAGICCWGTCSPTISRCTITANHNDDISGGAGAGLYVSSGASAALTDCTVSYNSANTGGGIYAYSGTFTLNDCTVCSNTANNGGGIFASSGTLKLNDCNVCSNTANNGGGIYAYSGTLTLNDCNVCSNTANRGGGIYAYDYSKLTLTGCTVNSNTANSGGGIYASSGTLNLTNCTVNSNTANSGSGGGICCDFFDSLTFTNCTVCSNTAVSEGGGIYASSDTLTFYDCTVFSNTANDGGGICWGLSNSVTITNCTVCSNTADNEGGGIYGRGVRSGHYIVTNSVFTYNISGDGGAVFAERFQDLIVRHCTFANNASQSGFGAGIACYEGTGTSIISHNIITGCEGGVGIYMFYTVAEINYNDLWDNPGGNYGGWAWPGEGDISVDPKFINPGYWDPNDTPNIPTDDYWVEGNYHLHWDSPCINAGDPDFVSEPGETDIDGQPRIRLGRVDMGADEADSNPADFNENGMVDFIDYNILSAAWLTEINDTAWNPLCNISRSADEMINALDLAAYCNHWLWQAAWHEP